MTAEKLHELLNYCPDTGIFTWIKRKGKLGKIAGSINQGYIRIGINKIYYRAHRLAWLYMTGKWPTKEIDHINGNKSDNRFCNLREADRNINCQNLQKSRIDNKSSALLGAYPCKGTNRWRSQIFKDGKIIHIGCFSTPEAAHIAYINVKRSLHPGCTI